MKKVEGGKVGGGGGLRGVGKEWHKRLRRKLFKKKAEDGGNFSGFKGKWLWGGCGKWDVNGRGYAKMRWWGSTSKKHCTMPKKNNVP